MRPRSCALLLCIGCFAEVDGQGSMDTGSSGPTSSTSAASSEATGSSTVTQTGSSTDADTTQTSIDPDSTGVPPECGNGQVESGEACDDANADELDGCTMACALGPRAIAFELVAPPAPVGTDGSIGDNASCYARRDEVPRALDGLAGWRGGVNAENAWTVSVRGSCTRWTLVDGGGTPQLALEPDPTGLPEYGNTSGQIDQWSSTCPAGAVPIGISGRVYPGGPPNIVAIRLECATPTLDLSSDPVVLLAAAQPSPWTDSDFMKGEQTALCPEGTIAVGFRGDISLKATAIYELGPLCARPVVVIGPP